MSAPGPSPGPARPLSALRALTWESWRQAWRPVVGVTLAACALAALYRRMLAPLGSQREALVFASMLFTLLVVLPLTLLTCREDGLALGFERRLLRLPVASWRLALQRSGFAWVCVAAMQCVVALFLYALYGDRWPLIGPALLQGAAVVWTLALAWTLGRRPYLIAPFGLVLVVALQGWMRQRLAEDPLWRRLSAMDLVVLLGATSVGAAVAIAGVSWQRREGGGGVPHRLRVAERVAGSLRVLAEPRERGAFSSPLRAQLWMEWREKGRLLTAWALLGLVTQLVAGSFRGGGARSLWTSGLSYAGLAAIALPAVSGFLHGRFDMSSRNPGIDRFRASRPLDDARLAWGVLLAAGRAAAAALLGVAASVTLLAAGLALAGAGSPVVRTFGTASDVAVRLGGLDAALAVLLAVLTIWGALGALATAALTGRNWVISAAAGTPVVLALVGIVGSRWLDRDLFPLALPLVGFGVAILPPVVVAIYAVAVKRGLLSGRGAIRVLLLAGSLGTLLVMRQPLLAEALFGTRELASRTGAVVAALVAFAALPLAGAPLALRWNRHR